MANKVVYNNISYDILDAITLMHRDYLLLVDPNNIGNITFLESSIIDGERKYSLPPKNFDISQNSNVDLKRLQSNFVMQKIVSLLINEMRNGKLTNVSDIKQRFNEAKSLIYTDETIKSILNDYVSLSGETFARISDYMSKYLDQQLVKSVNNSPSQEYTYLDRPLKNSDGLDYEWLYDLSLSELKELARDKNRTSEDLIYILDALDKRQKSDQAISNYTEMGHALSKTRKDSTAAFIDILLISLITVSFGLLLLLNIF